MNAWSESGIASALVEQVFDRKYLMLVPNCRWTGHECDLLVVTNNLHIIDVEIKVSRSDLKADSKKDKWRHIIDWRLNSKSGRPEPSKILARTHPPKVWKHYYCLPADIWTPSLLDALPSKSSGVIILVQRDGCGSIVASVQRRAIANKNADRITPQAAISLARLASLRMWSAYRKLDAMKDKILNSSS